MNPELVSSHPLKLFFRVMSTRTAPYSNVKLAGVQKPLGVELQSMCRSFETNFVPAQELKNFEKKRDNTRNSGQRVQQISRFRP